MNEPPYTDHKNIYIYIKGPQVSPSSLSCHHHGHDFNTVPHHHNYFLRCGHLRYSLSSKQNSRVSTNKKNKSLFSVTASLFFCFLFTCLELLSACLLDYVLVLLAQIQQTPPLCHCACSFKQQRYFFVHLFTVHFHCSHGRHYNINTIFFVPHTTRYKLQCTYIFLYIIKKKSVREKKSIYF